MTRSRPGSTTPATSDDSILRQFLARWLVAIYRLAMVAAGTLAAVLLILVAVAAPVLAGSLAAYDWHVAAWITVSEPSPPLPRWAWISLPVWWLFGATAIWAALDVATAEDGDPA